MTKIVSWNVNGIRSNIICSGSLKKSKKIHKELNECNLKNLIDEYDPDIICFQETKCSEEIGKQFQFPEYPFKYWNESKGEKHRGTGYSGTAIWSKIKPDFVDNKFKNDEIEFENTEGRFLIAKFPDFDLINVYVPNSGTNFKYRIEEWDENIYKVLQSSRDKPLIYTGDLNVVSTEQDIWNPESLPDIEVKSISGEKMKKFLEEYNGLLLEERHNIKLIYNDLYYLDIYRHLNPNISDKYSWWSQRNKLLRETNKGRRIDYFLIHADFRELISDCLILDEIIGSDHCPIMLELNV
jgi:exodeoxyribonuclease-3